MKSVSALSTKRDTDAALQEVVQHALVEIGPDPADLAVIFTTIHHAEGLGRIAGEVRRQGLGRHVVGCTGESVVGAGREVEGAPALSVWSLQARGLTITPRRFTFDSGTLSGVPDDSSGAFLLLGDPFTFPADQFLKRINEQTPQLRVVGGMASGASMPGQNQLALDDDVFEDGAIGVELGGPVTLRTIVSQGCRPIGRPMIVTRSDRNLIYELGRRPTLEVLREVFETLSPADQERVQQGLHIGRVINEYQESFDRGDFLVRNVIGADDDGGLAITDFVRVGQTVQFHIRDADTAHEDLRSLLEHERNERPGAHVAGALLFTCNGRGSRLFSTSNHDVGLIQRVFGPVPVSGFFAMGEIGSVGGQNFLHGYTASIVLFEEPA